MKKSISIISFPLIFILLLSSCMNVKKPPTEQSESGETSSQASSESSQTLQDGKILPDVPKDLDLNGYTFRLLYTTKYDQTEWGVDGIDVQEETGETFNDAAYKRNVYLEEKYNFIIEGIPHSQSEMDEDFYRNSILAGSDDYDTIILRQSRIPALMTSGCLVDLNNVPYIDDTKPWWDKQLRDQLTIGGKSYAAFSDFIISANNGLRILLFNKGMLRDYHLDNPYDLVNDGSWTIDNFYQMYKSVKSDINGDGIMGTEDKYGFIAQEGCVVDMLYNAGENITKKDAEDIPVLSIKTDRVMSVLQEISDLISDHSCLLLDGAFSKLYPNRTWYGLQVTFEDNCALFYAEVLQVAERMRATDVEFGILPMPKYDEAQENYYSFSDSGCIDEIVIPITNSNLEATGQILELLSAESYYTIRPAYYDISLKNKFMRDDESSEMLDIIFSNKVISLSEMFVWGGMHATLNSALLKGYFASVIESVSKRTETSIQKTLKELNIE